MDQLVDLILFSRGWLKICICEGATGAIISPHELVGQTDQYQHNQVVEAFIFK